ncbi:MAG: hypothetical protein ACJ8R9_29645 [Steroidobacteraceae bacterium]
MRVSYLPVFIVQIAVALGACAAVRDSVSPSEYLDQTTAATISVVAKPLVFAHERPDLAVRARDYVTLVGAAVNRSGAMEYYIFAYLWSTLDNRNRGGAPVAADTLTIAADDRRISSRLAGHSSQEAGVGSAIRAPPGHHWTLNVYRTDLATLGFIAEARHLAVITSSPEGPVTYEAWDDQRRALRGLVRRLEGQD